jgi:two-component system chemotaxis response regulator CheB
VRPLESDLAPPSVAVDQDDRPGQVSVFACPECHGTLWESEEGGVLRFRCRVGHVHSPDSMLASHTDSVDRALWAALRSLEERARTAAEHANVVRHLLHNRSAAQVVPDHVNAPEIPDPATPESVETKD